MQNSTFFKSIIPFQDILQVHGAKYVYTALNMYIRRIKNLLLNNSIIPLISILVK